ncbi:MAG TPA: amino acid transporter [Acidimicrobiaceae bacterium]|jgi:amino acid transporter|nr:amino acid transporter [Acidimicrobiaceae bacterium]
MSVIAESQESDEAGNKGLKAGALGLGSAIVIGVASTAPGYSLAAGLGGIVSEVGKQAPAIVWMAFIPMFFIASAYKYMNKVDPDCGTTFTWVTRSFGPNAGWMASWGLIMADLVIMPNLAGISGQYLFILIGKPEWADNKWAVLIAGVLFILAMTWICVIGIELNAKTQMGLLAAEVITLIIFAVVALAKANITPSLSWLNPFEITTPDGSMNWSAIAAGINLSLFIYWGWDTAVAVNEECADSDKTPGRAAVISTFILVANYVIVSFAVISVAGIDKLGESSDVLETSAETVFGNHGFGAVFFKLLVIAVLSSAAASCQTTILPAARSTLSMGVHKAIPAKFAETHPRYLTPTFSTWLFGGIAVAWFVFLVVISGGDWQGDNSPYILSISAVGLMIAFYYGATGYAAVAYFWRYLFKSSKAFFAVGLSSLLGALILTWSFVVTLMDDGGGKLTYIGLGLLFLGVPLMLACRTVDGGSFFRIKPDPMEDRPDPFEPDAHSPELGTYRKEV